jgi:hypothetical protein
MSIGESSQGSSAWISHSFARVFYGFDTVLQHGITGASWDFSIPDCFPLINGVPAMFRSLLIAFAVLVPLASTAQARGFRSISQSAWELQSQAGVLSEEVRFHLAGSPFQQRLRNDAAEIYRAADRLGRHALEGKNAHVLYGDARLIRDIANRMDRALTDAEVHAIRDPRRLGRIDTWQVRSRVAQMQQTAQVLERQLDVARRQGHRGFDSFAPGLDRWGANRVIMPDYGTPQYGRPGFAHDFYGPGHDVLVPQPVPVIQAGPAFTFSTGRFSFSVGR